MLIAGFVLFATGLMLIICYPINKKKNSRCTEQTQGMLTEIQARFNSKGSLKDMYVFSYQVDGVEYQLKTLDYDPQVSRVGDICTIWYNPEKPGDAQAFRGSDKYLKTILMVGIALVLLGIILIGVGFVQQFTM